MEGGISTFEGACDEGLYELGVSDQFPSRAMMTRSLSAQWLLFPE